MIAPCLPQLGAAAVQHQIVGDAVEIGKRVAHRSARGGRGLQPQLLQQIVGGIARAASAKKAKQNVTVDEIDLLEPTRRRRLGLWLAAVGPARPPFKFLPHHGRASFTPDMNGRLTVMHRLQGVALALRHELHEVHGEPMLVDPDATAGKDEVMQ